MERLSRFRRRWIAFVVAGVLAWILTLAAGAFGPLAAGAVAGLVAPRRGSFLFPALGVLASWALWFAVMALGAPVMRLGALVASVMGLPALHGVILPLVITLLAASIGGLAAAGVAEGLGSWSAVPAADRPEVRSTPESGPS